MEIDKKLSLRLPKIRLWGPKISLTPKIKLAAAAAAKDGLRDQLQRRAKSAGS